MDTLSGFPDPAFPLNASCGLNLQPFLELLLADSERASLLQCHNSKTNGLVSEWFLFIDRSFRTEN